VWIPERVGRFRKKGPEIKLRGRKEGDKNIQNRRIGGVTSS
jgi:hypothetical protein